jgi:hypothetical protein
VNDIPENFNERPERELTKVYERIIRKYQQVDQGIKSINRHIKLVITVLTTLLLEPNLILSTPHNLESLVNITLIFIKLSK